MMLPRRKVSLLASETFNMKNSSSFNSGRKNGKYPVFVVIFSVVLVFTFMYNEDVKSIAEYPFSSSGGGGASSPGIAHGEFARVEPSTEKYQTKEAKGSILESSTSDDLVQEQRATPERANGEPQKDAVKLEARVVESPMVRDEDVHEEATAKEPEPKPERERLVLDVPDSCDLFDGRWVHDDVSYPIYKEPECRFLTEQVTCMRNGRRDDGFQKWRWQPKHCSLPRFDARVMLERLRGKRLMFVGDSLNRNQWESMVCLVQSAVPWGKKTLTKNGSLNVFRLEEYNATVEFYWAPFLVKSNSDDPRIHSILNRIIMPKSIGKHGKHWKNVDYLIFNTYIWWLNTPTIKVLRGSFDEGSTEYDEVDRPLAYRRVLNTWSKWVHKNVDPNKTMVFFMSMSPNHIKSMDWDNPKGIKCALETLPVANLSHPLDVGTDWRLFVVAENVIKNLRKKVPVASFVKITALSEYRKDAHTSVHTLRQGKLLTGEQQADPATYADCLHWCLPGVPDTWNEFLYARIASSPWRD